MVPPVFGELEIDVPGVAERLRRSKPLPRATNGVATLDNFADRSVGTSLEHLPDGPGQVGTIRLPQASIQAAPT